MEIMNKQIYNKNRGEFYLTQTGDKRHLKLLWVDPPGKHSFQDSFIFCQNKTSGMTGVYFFKVSKKAGTYTVSQYDLSVWEGRAHHELPKD